MRVEITKAIFPVAGLGTRFLPVTKANPKEMLPVVDKPLIQYAVEEAVEAGIKLLIFVTSSSKHAIEDYFDSNFELEAKLAEGNKTALLEIVQSILPKDVSCIYIRQPQPLGLGHAVWCARQLINDEPCAVLLADDLIKSKAPGCLKQMIELYHQVNRSILAIEPVSAADVVNYGIVGLENNEIPLGGYSKVTSIIEKPKVEQAPSNYASIGRYILTPEIFNQLAMVKKGVSGEIQLTDGVCGLMNDQLVYGYRFLGDRYDCGNKLGYLKASIEYGIEHLDLGAQFVEYLSQLKL